ncbi:AraC family transcriptional regulator [Marinibactrum halimedae]|nr:AraC family transcriptional regulator [Marinibactrum halimedae]MCD9457429.1 AraC family transcriptional regulator [Marinibactrum halimedae]
MPFVIVQRVKSLLTAVFTVMAICMAIIPSAYSDASNASSGDETSNSVSAEQAQQEALKELSEISNGLQQLKRNVIELNSGLREMEEKLLFPSSTKYSVFVSLSSGTFFTLESVKLKLDGEFVATHMYSESQRQSLSRGGVQKLYITNLSQGNHTATAFFTGVGPNGRAYKLAQTLEFEKGDTGEYLELSIGDDASSQEPIVRMKQW